MGPDNVADLFEVLYRRRLTVLLVVVGALAGGMLFLNLVPKTYRAVASVLIPASPTRLSLHSETANIPVGPIVPDTREETNVGLIGVAASGAVHNRVAELLPGTDIRTLRRSLIIDIDRYKQLNFTAYDPKRERAVLLANTARDALRDVLREMVERAPRANLELLAAEERRVWERHGEARAALVAFLDKIGTPDLNQDSARLFGDRHRFQQQIESLEREELRMASERQIIAAILAERPEFVTMSQSLNRNNVYLELVNRLAELDTEMAVRGLEYTPEHPVMAALRERQRVARIQLKDQVENVGLMIPAGSTAQLDEESRKLVSSLIDFQLAESSLQVRRDYFAAQLRETEERLASLPLNRAQVELLEEDITRTKRLAEDLQDRVYEIELQLKRGLDFTWTDASRSATVDKTGSVPGRSGVLAFALISGLIVGVLLALGMELIAQTMRRRPF